MLCDWTPGLPVRWKITRDELWLLPVSWLVNGASCSLFRADLRDIMEQRWSNPASRHPVSGTGSGILRKGQKPSARLLAEDLSLSLARPYPGPVAACRPLERLRAQSAQQTLVQAAVDHEGSYGIYDIVPEADNQCSLFVSDAGTLEIWTYRFVFLNDSELDGIGRWEKRGQFAWRGDVPFLVMKRGNEYFIASSKGLHVIQETSQGQFIAKTLCTDAVLSVLDNVGVRDIAVLTEHYYLYVSQSKHLYKASLSGGRTLEGTDLLVGFARLLVNY